MWKDVSMLYNIVRGTLTSTRNKQKRIGKKAFSHRRKTAERSQPQIRLTQRPLGGDRQQEGRKSRNNIPSLLIFYSHWITLPLRLMDNVFHFLPKFLYIYIFTVFISTCNHRGHGYSFNSWLAQLQILSVHAVYLLAEQTTPALFREQS